MAKKNGIMKWYPYYMSFIGIVGQWGSFGQAYKTFATKSAGDLSLSAITVGFIAALSWLIYGCLLKNKPLILGNIAASIGMLFVLIGAILYR